MNFLNIKSFEDIKKLVATVGAQNLKNMAPLLAGFIPIPKDIKVKDEAKLRAQLASAIVLIVEMVENVE